MKKYLSILLIGLMCMLCTSCVTSTYAETGIGDEDVQVVIRYGTPYYYGNTLAYYTYNGYYFYPYRYHNVWRFHRYSRPPHLHNNWHHNNWHRHFGNYFHHPRNNGMSRPSRPSYNHGSMRSSTGHHFGGRR